MMSGAPSDLLTYELSHRIIDSCQGMGVLCREIQSLSDSAVQSSKSKCLSFQKNVIFAPRIHHR